MSISVIFRSAARSSGVPASSRTSPINDELRIVRFMRNSSKIGTCFRIWRTVVAINVRDEMKLRGAGGGHPLRNRRGGVAQLLQHGGPGRLGGSRFGLVVELIVDGSGNRGRDRAFLAEDVFDEQLIGDRRIVAGTNRR